MLRVPLTVLRVPLTVYASVSFYRKFYRKKGVKKVADVADARLGVGVSVLLVLHRFIYFHFILITLRITYLYYITYFYNIHAY